ncbi:MAG: hypothetical protein HC894_08845 [Microcoleus sp. SM1_3_4]|nr:hypothetical protein [Microcoleus sp. SM1_3_4]
MSFELKTVLNSTLNTYLPQSFLKTFLNCPRSTVNSQLSTVPGQLSTVNYQLTYGSDYCCYIGERRSGKNHLHSQSRHGVSEAGAQCCRYRR